MPPLFSSGLGSVAPFPIKLSNSRARYPLRTGHKRDFANVLFLCLPAACPPCLPCLLLATALHGFEGSAWARSLGVPLSDLSPLCGSINGRGGESRNVHSILSERENVKTHQVSLVFVIRNLSPTRRGRGGGGVYECQDQTPIRVNPTHSKSMLYPQAPHPCTTFEPIQ